MSLSGGPHKITYVVDFLRTLNAGTERQLGYLLDGLPAQGYQVAVISLQDSPFLSNEAPGRFPEVAFSSLGASSDISASLGSFWRLARQLRHSKPNLVHTFFPASNSVGVVAARLAGIRSVVSSRRDMGYHLTAKDIFALRVANRFVSRVIANSHAVADHARRTEGLPESKTMVIYNGVPFDAHATETPREAGATPIVGIVANLNREVKRVDLFIEAAARVLRRRPQVGFQVIGDGNLQPRLTALASELGVSERVEFLGRRDDVRALLARMSIGVICSDSEGFSNSIMEYMLSGLPVVATATGGNPEAIDDGVTGLLVEPGDPGQLADAVVRLLEDERLASRLGKAARESVRSRFSIEGLISSTVAVYSDILTRSG